MKFGTLFSGGGVVDCGLIATGLTPVFAVERDPQIAEVYKLNHGDHVLVGSVDEFDYSGYEIDLLWASPACQHYSTARSKSLPDHPDKDAGLYIIDVVRQTNPSYVFIENVPAYRHSEVFQEIINFLTISGYFVNSEVINCSDYGVPQNRRRLIVAASKKGFYRFPKKDYKTKGWYEAIADLIPDCPITELAPWQQKKLDGYDWIFADPRLVPRVGCRNFTTTAHYLPCPTIRALGHDNHYRQLDVVHRKDVRVFTPRCAARVMTAPDQYLLPSLNWLAWKIMGNGFPSFAAQKLIEVLK